MQRLLRFAILALLAVPMHSAFAQDDAASPLWVTYTGTDGPGVGKHIVLVSGDEEYRSEEALPQLGKILAVRHGFTCTVLFAIDPETGEIDPNNQQNIPGLESLAEADLMIIATRFRDLPDEQMRHIDEYVKSEKPIMGLRTATHAFAIKSSDRYKEYTWNTETGGFGGEILGETWVAHHGQHGRESTRGIISPMGEVTPITRGIGHKSIWGPTDVYKVRLPMREGCVPIVHGMVLAGMNPDDDPVDGKKNDPMMPIAWIQTSDPGDGKPSRTFTTTMGAATDLVAQGTRRMLVNATYWLLEMESQLSDGGADVRLVGEFEPTQFGFGGFVKGKTPADHRLTDDSLDSDR